MNDLGLAVRGLHEQDYWDRLELRKLAMSARVACLMGTYGRYSLAVESLACFLQQTTIDDAVLLIYNQHPIPLSFDHPRVRVVNETTPPQPLRMIKHRMVELMDDPGIEFFHFWDDDDLYLPWHLEDCLRHIGRAAAWKPASGWVSEKNVNFHLTQNQIEASWLIRAEVMRAAKLDTHQNYVDHPAMTQLMDAGLVTKTELGDLTSYIYRWDTGTQHLSGYQIGDLEQQVRDVVTWRAYSNEVQNEGRLIPADLRPRWRAFLDGIRGQVSPESHGEIELRLSLASGVDGSPSQLDRAS